MKTLEIIMDVFDVNWNIDFQLGQTPHYNTQLNFHISFFPIYFAG